LLAQTTLSAKLWHFWMLSASISPASTHSRHIGETFTPVLFRCRWRQPCPVMMRKLASSTLMWLA
jgi:hypothetical protein